MPADLTHEEKNPWVCNVHDGACRVRDATALLIAEHRHYVHGWRLPEPDRCVRCLVELDDTTNTAGWKDPDRLAYCDDCGGRGARERREAHFRPIRNFPRMSCWTFDTYPEDTAGAAAVKKAKAWVEATSGDQRNVLITGPVGTGKTGLAWSMAREMADSEFRAEFVNVRQLLAAARRSYSDPSAPDPLEGLDTAHLLVLDDLGAERPTEWALEVVATLIEERYQQEHLTIVTSNYTPSELIKRLRPPGAHDDIIGQRIVSRLMESCFQIRLSGADRRVNREAA